MTAAHGTDLHVQRRTFGLTWEAADGRLIIEANGKRLPLAVQAMVIPVGGTDHGTTWQTPVRAIDAHGETWTFTAVASAWQRKRLSVRITADEILLAVSVRGSGSVDRVVYGAGFPATDEPSATMGMLPWARRPEHRAWTASPLLHRTVANPQPNSWAEQELPAHCAQRITSATTFGPELFNTFFAPVLSAYVFDDSWSLGIAATVADSRHHHVDYRVGDGWAIELSFDGHTTVDASRGDGEWTAPALRIAPCRSAAGGWRDYADALRRLGLAPAPQPTPAWMLRPMVCGWGQQTVWSHQADAGQQIPVASPITPGAPGFATQAHYEEIVRLLDAHDLPWGTLTIDAGWSTCTTIPLADAQTWPDLKGFIAGLHRRGKRVLLWLGTWNPGGLAEDLRLPHEAGLNDASDPGNPRFRAQLQEAITHCLSSSGLDADGFKIDYTGDLPRGAGYRPTGGLWGLAMMHDYLRLIWETSRAAKADAVVQTHCAHPQFGDVTNCIRLNDIFLTRQDVRPAMAFRAEVAGHALPGVACDTDNDPFASTADWLEYMRFQPRIGIPSLYSLTHLSARIAGRPLDPITAGHLREVAAIWRSYLRELATAPAERELAVHHPHQEPAAVT